MERKLYELNRFDTDTQASLIEPQALAAGTTNSIWLGMANYNKAIFVIQGGAANDAAATLDVLVREAQDNVGGGAQAITGKAITQVVADVGFATLNDLWLIHVETPEMDVNNVYTHLQLQVIVSTDDTWEISAICMRQTRRYEPAPTTQVTELID